MFTELQLSEPADSQADFPRHGMTGLLASTLALLVGTFAIFAVLSFVVSFLAVLIAGGDAVAQFIAGLRLPSYADGGMALEPDAALLDLMQIVGLGLYCSHAASIWIAGQFGAKMPLARRVAWLDWNGDRQFWALLVAMLVYGVVAGLLIGWVYPESNAWTTLPKDAFGLAASLVLICFVGPVVEELFFRGWIFTGMRRRLAFVPTLLFTSVLFALMHYEHTHFYALAVFPVGLALGFVRERYGSIKASAFFHALYNLFSWVMIYFTMG